MRAAWIAPMAEGARERPTRFSGVRMIYRKREGTTFAHEVALIPMRGTTDDVMQDAVSAFRESIAFDGMQPGRDYCVNGVAVARFRHQRRAAVLILDLSI